jgi:hypothetical protein
MNTYNFPAYLLIVPPRILIILQVMNDFTSLGHMNCISMNKLRKIEIENGKETLFFCSLSYVGYSYVKRYHCFLYPTIMLMEPLKIEELFCVGD